MKTHPNDWHSIYAELASIIGKENAILLYQHYKGVYLNFPMRLLSKEGLERIVYAEYNSNNSTEIAKRYGYSVRHINRIIKKRSSV